MEQEISEFIDRARPLDLVFIAGDTLFSTLILEGSAYLRGNGEFSHCGIIVNRDLCPRIKTESDDLLLMEVTVSTADHTKSIETGQSSIGGQVRSLRDVLMEYSEKGMRIALGRLKNNPYISGVNDGVDGADGCDVRSVLCDVYNDYICDDKSVYEPNILALLGTVIPGVRMLRDEVDRLFSDVREKCPWLFCSELICIIYCNLGLLPNDIDKQAYLPVDFIIPDSQVYGLIEMPLFDLVAESKK